MINGSLRPQRCLTSLSLQFAISGSATASTILPNMVLIPTKDALSRMSFSPDMNTSIQVVMN